jgi:hypothetical protein
MIGPPSTLYSSTSYAPSFNHGGLGGNSNSVTPLTLGRNGTAAASNSFGLGPSYGNSTPVGRAADLYNNSSRNSGTSLTPIRQGMVTVNEEKGIRSFLWSKKWMVLKEQTLSFHKNEVSIARPRQNQDDPKLIRYFFTSDDNNPDKLVAAERCDGYPTGRC